LVCRPRLSCVGVWQPIYPLMYGKFGPRPLAEVIALSLVDSLFRVSCLRAGCLDQSRVHTEFVAGQPLSFWVKWPHGPINLHTRYYLVGREEVLSH
jgi:hypothetical protein